MTNYAFENLLRTPWEGCVAACAATLGIICLQDPTLFGLNPTASYVVSGPLFILSAVRLLEGIKVYRYKKRLLILTPFSLATAEIPLSHEQLYLGQGFIWTPIHRQRLHLLSLVENQAYLKHSPTPSSVGGKPWLHGVGSDQEHAVTLAQPNRHSHVVVFGTTRVGKTRLMSILVNQDIRNQEAVLVIDPKGDLELLQSMIAACQVAGRLDDLIILHPGFPKASAKYNPLVSYDNVSEVVTRVTSAIQAEGEGKQFQDFAWKFLNITATCLEEMGELINYKSLAFYVIRPKELLYAYCEKKLSNEQADYQRKVEEILNKNTSRLDAKGNVQRGMTRAEATRAYLSQHIEHILQSGDTSIYDSIIADLHYAASLGEEYYSKIIACLGPVFDKINKTAAGSVFSWEANDGLPVISLDTLIQQKKVVYMGLDALSNSAMANAVGQAIIADLVSLCGRLYKANPEKKHSLCLHADEFSNIVRDEFIGLLNKAGGAGIKVTAYTQTVNDLGVVFGGNHDKKKMLLGNFGTTIMLRVENQDTAKTFTECLETIRTRSSTPSTLSSDRPNKDAGELFSTQNTDSVNEQATTLVEVNDLFSLPKGQAFMITDGGKVYKIRIPLPKNDYMFSNDFSVLLEKINKKS